MTHSYQITGMTCSGCEAKVKLFLKRLPAVQSVTITREKNRAEIAMDSHIGITQLQEALGGPASKYQISQAEAVPVKTKSQAWWVTYRPILMIFFYISGVTLLAQWGASIFDWQKAMTHFMAGFFLVFSFFKMLNLEGFADSYRMYDVVARAIPVWAYLYAFVELGLGVAYLTGVAPLATNLVTLIVMSVSIVGVLQTVLNKKKIQCACLGAVFNLPMSTVTIIEDALMIAMSALTVLHLL